VHQPTSDEPLVLVAGSGWDDHIQVGERTVPGDRNSNAGYPILSNEPVVAEDLDHEARFIAPPLLLDHGLVAGMSVEIKGRRKPYGVLSVFGRHRRPFSVDDGDFLRSVANIIASAVDHRQAVETIEQSARYEAALAECAQALLASAGEDRIQRALQALFVATEATYVFLERNVVDAELGFCSQFTVRTRRIQPRRVLVHRSTPQGLKAESANFEIEVPKSETPGNAWGFLRSGGGI